MTAGCHQLITLSWYITHCPTCKSCEGNASCLSMFLITSGWIPSCFLEALDTDKSDLALLPCRICIDNCKLHVRRYCSRSSKNCIDLCLLLWLCCTSTLQSAHTFLQVHLTVGNVRSCNMLDTEHCHDTGEGLRGIAWTII